MALGGLGGKFAEGTTFQGAERADAGAHGAGPSASCLT